MRDGQTGVVVRMKLPGWVIIVDDVAVAGMITHDGYVADPLQSKEGRYQCVPHLAHCAYFFRLPSSMFHHAY